MTHPIVDTHLNESLPSELLLDKHTTFLLQCAKEDDCTLDYLKLNGIYWTLTALDLMDKLHRIDREEVIKLIVSCQSADGGLSPAPLHDSHLLSTLSGIQVLALFDSLDRLDTEAVVRYVLSLQQPDGSFSGDCWGEIDTRFSFCALASLHLLGRLEECFESGQLDKEKCGAYLERCQNADGGFGVRPGCESHAGQAYCVLGSLAILRELRRLDLDRAAWWLCQRQLPSGGLNGRPEKQPDVCYSWWALASLTILGRTKWIDECSLARFILAAQDEEKGGIADRPGDVADPFHTLFGLAGLSLLAQADDGPRHLNGDSAHTTETELAGVEAIHLAKTRLKRIHPVFCMPQHVIDRMNLKVQLIS